MKWLIAILASLSIVSVGRAQLDTVKPMRIVPDVNYPAVVIHGSTNSVSQAIVIKNEIGTAGSIGMKGQLSISATTNQLSFGATNSAPVNTTNIAQWVSVQVAGDTNAYRLPLYK